MKWTNQLPRGRLKGAHLGGVYGLGFADDTHVVSSGEDACIRVWSLTDKPLPQVIIVDQKHLQNRT
ncbi:hypothetical protein Bca101_067588 [Brassica carinata]